MNKLAMYRNTHPVITLSLKCAKQGDYVRAIHNIRYEIQNQFKKYRYVWESDHVDKDDRNNAIEIMRSDANEEILGNSIKLLSSCLKQYYGVNAIILIDEYDVPLEDAYFSGYYDDMVRFIRSLFESALKSNQALEFSVITGCLRISKESIFTGLNNLEVNSILSDTYSDCFGFVQSEVDELMRYYEIDDKRQKMKMWYDGYRFGKSEVYNPWSVLNQAKTWVRDTDAFAVAWWANTSSNNIIKALVSQSDDETKAAAESLIHGGCVKTHLKETVTYGDLIDSNENIWSFLFFTGYLKVDKVIQNSDEAGEPAVYSLVIPNLEIKSCYKEIIIEYFNAYKREVNKEELYRALLSRDAAGFAAPITNLLKATISFYDNTEAFYHGLVAGLLAGNIYYKAESNRETGNGRSDLILYQQDCSQTAIILEFKVCRGDESADTAAKRALQQINDRDYAARARSHGYKNIIKYGVAFKDKMCYAVVE